MDVSPPRRFVPTSFHPLPGRFTSWMIRPLDDSPRTRERFAPGRFTPKRSVLGVSHFRRGRTAGTDEHFAALTHLSCNGTY